MSYTNHANTPNIKTIEVKSTGVGIRDEHTADGSIIPGMLLEYSVSGDSSASDGTLQVKAHSGGAHESGANKPSRRFALEDELQGNGISDSYDPGDLVQHRAFLPGEEVFTLIADGEWVHKGDYLVSNGDGKLKVFTADSSATKVEETIVGVAKTECNMSDSSAVDALEHGEPASYGRCVVEIV